MKSRRSQIYLWVFCAIEPGWMCSVFDEHCSCLMTIIINLLRTKTKTKQNREEEKKNLTEHQMPKLVHLFDFRLAAFDFSFISN